MDNELFLHLQKTPQRPEQSGGRRKGDLDSPKAPDVLSFSSSSGRRKGDLDNPDDDYGSKEKALEIQMPGAEPKRADEYFCTAFDLGKLTGGRRVYATAFDARATADRAHHLIVEKCQLPFKEEGQIWCGSSRTFFLSSTSLNFCPGTVFITRLVKESPRSCSPGPRTRRPLPCRQTSGLSWTQRSTDTWCSRCTMRKASRIKITPDLA